MSSSKREKTFRLSQERSNLREVMMDRGLASLGDAFVNLVYSLALSRRKGKPIGAKVKGTLLAEALRKAGLRNEFLPRSSSHDLADAAEALIVHSWLIGYFTLEEAASTLEKADTIVSGLTLLLERAKRSATSP